MGNLIIGMGNTGTQIVKLAAQSELLSKTSMYVIDSQASQIDMDTVTRITTIPIVSRSFLESTSTVLREVFF